MIKETYTHEVLKKLTKMFGVHTCDSAEENKAAIRDAMKKSATPESKLSQMVDQAYLEVKEERRINRKNLQREMCKSSFVAQNLPDGVVIHE